MSSPTATNRQILMPAHPARPAQQRLASRHVKAKGLRPTRESRRPTESRRTGREHPPKVHGVEGAGTRTLLNGLRLAERRDAASALSHDSQTEPTIRLTQRCFSVVEMHKETTSTCQFPLRSLVASKNRATARPPPPR